MIAKGGMEQKYGKAPAAGRGQRVKRCYDIVGSLPLELVIQVVRSLDEADIVRNQRVRTTIAYLSIVFKKRGIIDRDL